MEQLQGKWEGILVYGVSYGKWAGNTLRFAMELKTEGSYFKGNSIDIEGFGLNPDSATLEGEFGDGKIKFSKQYASYHYASGGKHKRNTKIKGPWIQYQGFWDKENEKYTGTWYIHNTTYFLGLIPIKNKTEGRWEMWKLKAQTENNESDSKPHTNV